MKCSIFSFCAGQLILLLITSLADYREEVADHFFEVYCLHHSNRDINVTAE